MSLVLLATVVLALIVVQIFVMWQITRPMQAGVPERERVMAESLQRYLETVALEDRTPSALELGKTLGVPVTTMALADPRISASARSALGARGSSFELAEPLEAFLYVRVPETDHILRLRLKGMPLPALWKALTLLLGLVAMVAVVGTLLARPLVVRLRRLQEASVRIARGELGARALVSGKDDLAEFARHFNQMAERNQILVEKQRDLMRAVSHELRTPTARIRFALELLAETKSQHDHDRHVSAIDSDLTEIDCLVQELVALDRLDRMESEDSAKAESFDGTNAVSTEIERLRPSRAEVEVSTMSALPEGAYAAGSERLFRRAVRNLLSNAVRHARFKVRVSLAYAGGKLLVSIDDDGPGIPELERARVLEPFSRLDPSRSRDSGGLGLGLTIVDRILATAGGRLEISESELGGASVTMSWPAHTE
jgi:signal transduction histidine kinase